MRGARPSWRFEQARRFSDTPIRTLPLRDARHFLCEEASLAYTQLGATGRHPHPPTPLSPGPTSLSPP
jgi:hypothetical protein